MTFTVPKFPHIPQRESERSLSFPKGSTLCYTTITTICTKDKVN